ncbi:MAG: TetR/AcrR family transcriptional regulator [Lentisphaerae bacterium]|nr:TetR/AcrR family transcriptional regulator [Lentisphaerota bacterium]
MTASAARHHLKERRRERERDLSRQDILSAAERVFSAEGFDAATMEAIAAAAGFSVGSLYNFFASKADLCRNVIEDILADMVAQLDPLTATDGAAPALRAFVRIRVQDIERHRGFFKVMASGGIGGGKGDYGVPIHALFARFHGALIDRLAALIGALPRTDEPDAEDPVTVALAVDGFVLAASRYWSHQAPETQLRDKLPMIERMALRIAGVSGINLQDCEADKT